MKTLIKNILKVLGYNILKLDNYPNIKYLWLDNYNIKTIIDVGANEGQFALSITKTLKSAKVFSFEPLPETYHELKKNLVGNTNITAFNTALGDFNGNSKIFKNDYSPSSSMLELGKRHIDAYPDNDKVVEQEISVRRFDDFLKETDLKIETNILFKLDVQGFEDKVLAGSTQFLKLVKIVFIEVSFWELYKGQALFPDIYKLLTDAGFTYRGNYDLTFNNNDGLPIFADAIFIRE